MKQILLVFFFIFLFLIPINCYAESNYVLPYPPGMPGTSFYKIRIVFENLEKFWYLGNFSQYYFNLKQADKYLVQAKVLFEYRQYLLALDALHKSDLYYKNASPFLDAAKNEGKNINKQHVNLVNASEKHIEELILIKETLPKTFIWKSEKSSPIILHLHQEIDRAIEIRRI